MAGQQAEGWLRRLPSQTAEERAALARLKPSWGTGKHRQLFQRAVRQYLAAIQALALGKQTEKSPIAQFFRRRARATRYFVNRMQRPIPTRFASGVVRRTPVWPPPLPWVAFPSRELLLHMDICDSWALWFAKLPRRPASRQNRQIIQLSNFVRLYTGKPHLPELAKLLKRPCGDQGMTAARLDQLLRDHAKVSADVRREIKKARAGIYASLKK